jgi:hypothetical protein
VSAEQTERSSQQALLSRIFTSPWFGGIAGLAGIAALLTGIYFYYASKAYRSLTFYVPPVKSVIVSGGQLSDLQVFFRKKPVQNVTIAQMAIWNRGNEAIRKEHALDQIKIVLRPATPILKASVIKVTRPVVEFTCDESQMETGSVPLSWNILEQDDGALVQVVYAGSSNVQLDLEGDIEGQKKIVKLEYGGKILSPSEQIRRGYGDSTIVIVLLSISALFLGASSSFLWKQWQLGFSTRRAKIEYGMLVIMVGALLVLSVHAYVTVHSVAPSNPFGI